MNDAMEIRRLGRNDAPLLEAVVRDLLLPEDRLQGRAGCLDLAQAVADRGSYYIVCTLGAAPVGFLSAYRFPAVDHDGFLVYLYDIIVRGDNRRRGIGARLVAALKEECLADGVTRIWVGTSLDNRAAQKTFEATGAQRVSETYVEYIYDLA